MEISPEILKRYASGQCTEEERLLVENWMPSTSDIPQDLDWDSVNRTKSEIWNEVAMTLPQPSKYTRMYFHPMMKYGAAACLLVGLAGVLLLGGNGASSLRAEESNREIQRLVKSSGTVSIRELLPTANNVSPVKSILTHCPIEDCTPRLIELNPEETYYAIRFQAGSDKAAIFNSEELGRFTPSLWRRIVSINLIP